MDPHEDKNKSGEEEENLDLNLDEDKKNPVMSSLFDAVEDDGVDEDTPVRPGRSLSDALAEDLEGGEGDNPKPDGDKGGEGDNPKPDGDKGGEGDNPKPKPGLKHKPPRQEPEPLPEFKSDNSGGDDDTPDLADLGEHERERFELAQFAESLDDGYKGLSGKYLDFFKAHREYVANAQKEDPDVEFDEDNDDYQEFLRKNRPQLTDREVRKLEREQILHEAEFRAIKKFEKELAERDRELQRIKTEPEVKSAVESFSKGVREKIYPEEVAKAIAEKGEEEARKEYAFEMEVLGAEMESAERQASTYLNLARSLESFNQQNSDHVALDRMIREEGIAFYEKGGARRVKDGKKFLPRHVYFQAQRAGKADEYWTFSDTDILDLLSVRASRTAKARLDEEAKRLERFGFSRQGKQTSPSAGKQETTSGGEDDTPPPKARSGSSPGASTNPPAEGGKRNTVFDVFDM